MNDWDANFIQSKFDEVNRKLSNLETSVSQQTQLLERKLENLNSTISSQKNQGSNSSVKIATLSGIISAALFEVIQIFAK